MQFATTSQPRKIAVLGANGFVGSRLVEMLHLLGSAEVKPIVRSVASLARLSRFEIPFALADCRNQSELKDALKGCIAVVDCTVGMPSQIKAGARALIPAAHAAGVRRVIYLSSASVHGQNPALGSNELSPLSDRQEMEYNNAKVRAERLLFSDAARYDLELFVLRPSIVIGPRDRWVSSLIDELQRGQAWLINAGTGICNTIYVDNLVEAIRCCLLAPADASGHAFLVGDAEEVCWKELYEDVAIALGISIDSIHQLPVPPRVKPNMMDRLGRVRAHPIAQQLMPMLPRKLKDVSKGALDGLQGKPTENPWLSSSSICAPTPSREMVLLQQCRHRFSYKRAMNDLGYQPVVSFQDGIKRTLAWHRWREHITVNNGH